MKTKSNMESILLKQLKSGETFFTYKNDNSITALANYYGVKVYTERYICFDKATNKKIEQITKVTIQ